MAVPIRGVAARYRALLRISLRLKVNSDKGNPLLGRSYIK
jgi:hypothetical protein